MCIAKAKLLLSSITKLFYFDNVIPSLVGGTPLGSPLLPVAELPNNKKADSSTICVLHMAMHVFVVFARLLVV